MSEEEWSENDRAILEAVWQSVRDFKGAGTGQDITLVTSVNGQGVCFTSVMFALGVLAHDKRIRPTYPDRPLPNGEWSRVLWTAIET